MGRNDGACSKTAVKLHGRRICIARWQNQDADPRNPGAGKSPP